MKEKEKPMPRKKPIYKLTNWEWITLVASWRYYEYGRTIVSATFPEDMVTRFFQGAYTKRVCEQIARQFAETDHSIRGEEDWTKDEYLRECDKLPWIKFFRFCQGYVAGFHKVVLKSDDLQQEVDAFHVDWNDHWYPVEKYCECPYREIFCAPEFIISIDGISHKKESFKRMTTDELKACCTCWNEMKYSRDGKTQVLARGNYLGLHFLVLNSRGRFPCGYVNVDGTPLSGKSDWELEGIDCHGGLTYTSCTAPLTCEDGWWIGWDYGHWGDFDIHKGEGEKYGTEDVVQECINVIQQVVACSKKEGDMT